MQKVNIISINNFEELFLLLNDNTINYKVFAGGTDLMVEIHNNKNQSTNFIILDKLHELKNIIIDKDYIKIGALSTFSDIIKNTEIKKEFNNLYKASKEIGSIAIQNRATIAGNIANASPAADSVPALLSYNAKLEIKSLAETRIIMLEDFFKSYKNYDLKHNEIITAVILDKNNYYHKDFYQKVGTRKALSIAKINISSSGYYDENKLIKFNLAVGSLAEIPKMCKNTAKEIEAFFNHQSNIDKVINVFTNEILPIDDIRSTKEYREIVAVNLLKVIINYYYSAS